MNITRKQRSYILKLCKTHNIKLGYSLDGLTTKQASGLIRSLLVGKTDSRLTPEIVNIKNNIKYFKRNKLLPEFIDGDNITNDQIRLIDKNLCAALDILIPMLEDEMGDLENRLIENSDDDYASDRIGRINSRYIFMKGIREKGITDINIQGMHRKLTGYINQLTVEQITLMDDKFIEVLKDSTIKNIYI